MEPGRLLAVGAANARQRQDAQKQNLRNKNAPARSGEPRRRIMRDERTKTFSAGRSFRIAQGIILTAQGVGASLSTTLAAVIVVRAGYSAAFLTLAAIAGAGFILYWFAVPETWKPQMLNPQTWPPASSGPTQIEISLLRK